MEEGKWGEVELPPLLQSAVAAGAVAGNIVVAAIKVTDTLMVVQNVAAAGVNLVGQFTITADGVINNAGGTNTTGMVLLILWYNTQIPTEISGV